MKVVLSDIPSLIQLYLLIEISSIIRSLISLDITAAYINNPLDVLVSVVIKRNEH